MSHFDELSQKIGTKVQKACRKHRGEEDLLRHVVADPEVLGAMQNLIYHYKIMTYEEPISTERAVPESDQPLPTAKRHEDTYG